jgi:hypothetical protein
MAKVIEANTGITNLQRDIFTFKASISGTVSVAAAGGRLRSARGLAGVTVRLEDESGNVVATTVTGRNRAYSFNQHTGLNATGNYTVRIMVLSGFTQMSANPATILIGRGDINVQGVDFTLVSTGATTSATVTQVMSAGTLDPAAVDTVFSTVE